MEDQQIEVTEIICLPCLSTPLIKLPATYGLKRVIHDQVKVSTGWFSYKWVMTPIHFNGLIPAGYVPLPETPKEN